MESVVLFEKKLFLSPTDFNLLKTTTLDELLVKKAKSLLEGKCSEHGYVVPGSIKILSRSMGYFESARFTGDAIYYVKLEGKVIYPVDGHQLVGEVIRKNKMGLYVNYKNAIHIQVPRDLHIDGVVDRNIAEDFDSVEVGEYIRVEIKRSKFAVYDPYILASGLFIELADEEDQNEEESDDENNDDYVTNNESSLELESEDEEPQEEESEEEEPQEEEPEEEDVEQQPPQEPKEEEPKEEEEAEE
jgi:hypothetical protein